jgi:hypothetical protein
LEERIGKSSRKHQGRSEINNESTNEFSGGKQRENQVRINPTSQGQNHNFSGNPKDERGAGNRKLGRSLKVFASTVECKGTRQQNVMLGIKG